jgi:hypothetical protein
MVHEYYYQLQGRFRMRIGDASTCAVPESGRGPCARKQSQLGGGFIPANCAFALRRVYGHVGTDIEPAEGTLSSCLPGQ